MFRCMSSQYIFLVKDSYSKPPSLLDQVAQSNYASSFVCKTCTHNYPFLRKYPKLVSCSASKASSGSSSETPVPLPYGTQTKSTTCLVAGVEPIPVENVFFVLDWDRRICSCDRCTLTYKLLGLKFLLGDGGIWIIGYLLPLTGSASDEKQSAAPTNQSAEETQSNHDLEGVESGILDSLKRPHSVLGMYFQLVRHTVLPSESEVFVPKEAESIAAQRLAVMV